MSAGVEGAGSPIVEAMRLEWLGDGSLHADNVAPGGGDGEQRTVVFGGQLLGQMLMAAVATVPGKRPYSVQTVFCRAASTAAPLEIATEVVHSGRSLATVTVTVSQAGKAMSRALVTLDAGDEDVMRHEAPMPDVGRPADAVAADWAEPGSELRVVDGVDLATARATGEPRVHVWARFPGAPDDPVLDQALAAWYTDMFVMGAAMRPHDGVGFEVAHERISTGVFSHSLVFHEPWPAREWFLVSQEATYAGRGRYYGVGSLYGKEGKLFASFSQTGLVRAMPAHYGEAPDRAQVM